MDSEMMTLSLVNIFALLALTAVNIKVAQSRMSSTITRDSRRLRVALRTELAGLLGRYEENRRCLAERKRYLLSTRAFACVYRANLGRLNLLHETTIPKIVSAYASSEKIEHLLAATCKAAGPMTYRIIADETPTDDILEEYAAGCADIRSALGDLDGVDRDGAETAAGAVAALAHRRPVVGAVMPGHPLAET